MSSLVVKMAILVLSATLYSANQQCEFLNELSTRPFYKIKLCHRSNLAVISRINVRSLLDCMNFARERGGLAINFSPPGASVLKSYQDYFFVNCQVLGCPEIGNSSSTMVNDSTFDYYSLFGDLSALESTSCITSVGLFHVFQDRTNYTTAIQRCQEIGGDLAHVVSETRTHGLSSLLAEKLNDWYKIAYVGLDDKYQEGVFRNPMGEALSCFKFRAWGPGQPRNKERHEDCVVLDSESAWKVVDCREELPFVCELYPTTPPKTAPENATCSGIKDKGERDACKAAKKKPKIPQQKTNTTTLNRC